MSFYITQLFTNQSEIRTRGDGKTVVYNDNLSQLKLDRTTNVVTFFENRSGEETLLYTNNLTQTFGRFDFPVLANIPVIGDIFFKSTSLLGYLAIAFSFLAWFILFRLALDFAFVQLVNTHKQQILWVSMSTI